MTGVPRLFPNVDPECRAHGHDVPKIPSVFHDDQVPPRVDTCARCGAVREVLEGGGRRWTYAPTIKVESMRIVRTTLAELRKGDVVVATNEVVEGVQVIGPITIVDFVDGTATAPLPSNGMTEVLRRP